MERDSRDSAAEGGCKAAGLALLQRFPVILWQAGAALKRYSISPIENAPTMEKGNHATTDDTRTLHIGPGSEIRITQSLPKALWGKALAKKKPPWSSENEQSNLIWLHKDINTI